MRCVCHGPKQTNRGRNQRGEQNENATRSSAEIALCQEPIRDRATDKARLLPLLRVLWTEHTEHTDQQGTSYKLFSIDRLSYIVPILAGHDGRKNLVLHASNYIVHLYPTVQKSPSVLIVIAAYSDSVITPRESACLNLQSSDTQQPQGVLPCVLS